MKALAPVFAAALIASACTTNGGIDPSVTSGPNIGAAIGGVAGAVGCAELFEDKGSRAGWTAACALLGSQLGRSFMLGRDAKDSLETARTGQTNSWTNPDGHEASITPTRTFFNDANAPCREFRSVVEIDGKQEIATGTACRDASGEWRVQP
ncbi:hypothetical protein OAS86_02745 [Gammaproteobacteria bacterium]|nr:hypothetical protein [Gammaproteobacteria bacterium]